MNKLCCSKSLVCIYISDHNNVCIYVDLKCRIVWLMQNVHEYGHNTAGNIHYVWFHLCCAEWCLCRAAESPVLTVKETSCAITVFYRKLIRQKNTINRVLLRILKHDWESTQAWLNRCTASKVRTQIMKQLTPVLYSIFQYYISVPDASMCKPGKALESISL